MRLPCTIGVYLGFEDSPRMLLHIFTYISMANMPHRIHMFSSPPKSVFEGRSAKLATGSGAARCCHGPCVQPGSRWPHTLCPLGRSRQRGRVGEDRCEACAAALRFLFVQLTPGFVSKRPKQSCELWVPQHRMQLHKHQITKRSFYCYSLFFPRPLTLVSCFLSCLLPLKVKGVT